MPSVFRSARIFVRLQSVSFVVLLTHSPVLARKRRRIAAKRLLILFERTHSRYLLSVQANSSESVTAASRQSSINSPQYAEVVLPVHVGQAFTYRLTESMQDFAQPGGRILVPFGRKLIVGYIVGLHKELKENLTEVEIKEAEELIDAVPLIAADVLELTRWVAEYYAAPWGEVLKAALPPGISQSIEQLLTLTDQGYEELSQTPERKAATHKLRLLTLIADKGELSLRAAARDMGQAQAMNAARALEKSGAVVIRQGQRNASAREKLQRVARLMPATDTNDATTEAQSRVVSALESAGGSLALKELLLSARTSESAVRTLQKKGRLDVINARFAGSAGERSATTGRA